MDLNSSVMGCCGTKSTEDTDAQGALSLKEILRGEDFVETRASLYTRQNFKSRDRNKSTRVIENYTSLLHHPPIEQLVKAFWIRKRGHMVRSWKRRYCVIGVDELRYYKAADDQPPYGKGLKGKVSLIGAVCTISLTNRSSFMLEIAGTSSEKDLMFELQDSVEAHVSSYLIDDKQPLKAFYLF